MTEDDAKAWIEDRLTVPRETVDRLSLFARILTNANGSQNLISEASVPDLWGRHIVDSAQLLLHGPVNDDARWVDLGSGPGLPGLVLAILNPAPITLVELRPLRCAFLLSVREQMGLDHVSIVQGDVKSITGRFDVITARAFAPLEKLLKIARPLAKSDSIWVLPKGKSGSSELAQLPIAWQKRFTVQQSATASDAAILVGRGQFC